MFRKLSGLKTGRAGISKDLRAARRGDAAAMKRVGLCYLRGAERVAPHAGHAVWWLERAVDAGEATACVHAARLAWDGFSPDEQAVKTPVRTAPRVNDAFRFARQGYAAGDPEAALFLAWLLDATKSEAPEERKQALRFAASHRAPLALVGLADIEAREGASAERLMELMREPLAAGLGSAHYLVGLWHGRGDVLPRDAGKSRFYLEKAVEKQHPLAEAMLGECLMAENHRKPGGEDHGACVARLRRLTQGETLLRKAAVKHGNGRAACVLGDYWTTIVDPPDLREALKWYDLAISQGNPGAMYMVAHLALTGRTRHVSEQGALKLLEQAAEGGHKKAVAMLHFYCEKAVTTEEDAETVC